MGTTPQIRDPRVYAAPNHLRQRHGANALALADQIYKQHAPIAPLDLFDHQPASLCPPQASPHEQPEQHEIATAAQCALVRRHQEA